MTERKRETYIKKEITEYISKDGRVFDNIDACLSWEKELENLNAKFNGVETNPEVHGWMNIDGCEHSSDAHYDWYLPKSKEELDTLKDYFGDPDADFDDSYIGKWICVEQLDSSAWVSELESGIYYAKTLLEKFGYKVTIEKNQ